MRSAAGASSTASAIRSATKFSPPTRLASRDPRPSPSGRGAGRRGAPDRAGIVCAHAGRSPRALAQTAAAASAASPFPARDRPAAAPRRGRAKPGAALWRLRAASARLDRVPWDRRPTGRPGGRNGGAGGAGGRGLATGRQSGGRRRRGAGFARGGGGVAGAARPRMRRLGPDRGRAGRLALRETIGMPDQARRRADRGVARALWGVGVRGGGNR